MAWAEDIIHPWIVSMLDNRKITVKTAGEIMEGSVVKGCL
jgi:hypothetical protein